MDKAKLYTRSNFLQRRDAESVIDEYGHLLVKFVAKSKETSSSSSSSDDDEEEELQQVVTESEIDPSSASIRLLDIGTGSGDVLVDFILPLFAERGAHLVGTDISSEMIRFGREEYEDLKRVSFDQFNIVGDVRGFLQRQDDLLFDHVTSFYCLHWVQDQLLAMRNIYSLLKDSGNCLLAFIGNMAIFDIYEDMAQTEKWKKFMFDVEQHVSPYQHVKEPSEYAKNLMAEAGFQDIIVDAKQLRFHYNGIQNLRKAVKAVNPFTKRMVDQDVEEYLDDYLSHVRNYGLMENPEDAEEDIKIRVDYTLLVVYARK